MSLGAVRNFGVAATMMVGLWLAAPQTAQAQSSPGCTAVNGFTLNMVPSTVFNATTVTALFFAGDAVTITVTGAAGWRVAISPPDGSADILVANGVSVSRIYTNATALTASITVESFTTAATSGTLTISCGVGSGSTISGPMQNAINAQFAIANGQMVLQQTGDAIKLAVLGSFTAKPSGTPLAALAARARVARIEREAAELVEELGQSGGAPGDNRRGDLEDRLALTRRNLVLARGSLEPAAKPVSASVALFPGMDRSAPAGEQATTSAPTSLRFERSRVEDACSNDECAPTPGSIGPGIWSVWLDARAIGATDSIARQSGLGFIGNAGADYKLQPWLTLGVTVGAETFETRLGTGGLRMGERGMSAIPYLGVRIDPNIFVSAYVGASRLNYDTAPAVGITGQFDAWRFLTGAALTGVWREQAWRFQPSLSVAYASETQSAYANSANTAVAS